MSIVVDYGIGQLIRVNLTEMQPIVRSCTITRYTYYYAIVLHPHSASHMDNLDVRLVLKCLWRDISLKIYIYNDECTIKRGWHARTHKP